MIDTWHHGDFTMHHYDRDTIVEELWVDNKTGKIRMKYLRTIVRIITNRSLKSFLKQRSTNQIEFHKKI